MLLRKTEYADIDSIMQIIGAAKIKMRESGINQWQSGTPNREMIETDVKNGESYVVTENGRVTATAMISFAGEPTYVDIYDGQWLTDCDYCVLHRVAVADDQKRKGMASFMFKQAMKLCEQNGVPSLRVDTHRDNIPMRTALEHNGFTHCGTIFLANGAERVAYEKLIQIES